MKIAISQLSDGMKNFRRLLCEKRGIQLVNDTRWVLSHLAYDLE